MRGRSRHPLCGLNPANRVLSERYEDILSPQPGSVWHDDCLGSYFSHIALRPTADLLGVISQSEELSHITHQSAIKTTFLLYKATVSAIGVG